MKKILYILVLSFAFFGCEKSEKKTYANCTKGELEINANLIPYLDAFVDDCETHNIKSDHAYCLNYIKLFSQERPSFQGQTSFEDGTIIINENLIEDTIGTKFVFYHELGHWFGLDHSTGIMKESYNTKEDMEYVRDNWDELLEDYFDKLKTK